MPRLQLCCLLLCLANPAAAQVRVFVQEIHGRDAGLQMTTDGKLAWLVGGVNDHILHVLDPKTATVLARYYLPDRIECVTIDSQTRRVAVSTRSAIHMGRLTDDALPEILPGLHGAILLNDGADLLAVLGNVPNPKAKLAPRSLSSDERTLGVYDLKSRSWRFVQRTLIVSPYLQAFHDSVPPALLFHGHDLLAAGVGGSLGSMIPITFQADVRLNLKTGKARISHGPLTRFGKLVKLPAGKGDASSPTTPPGLEGTDFVIVPDYAFPEHFTKARDAAAASTRTLQDDKALQALRLVDRINDAAPMPFDVDKDGVRIAVRRFLRIEGDFNSHTAVLTLSRDGKIALGPTRETTDNRLARGSVSSLRFGSPDAVIDDVITGQPILPADALKTEGSKDLYFLDGVGTLLQADATLSLFKPGKLKPEWTRASPPRRNVDAQLDADRKIFALTYGEDPTLAEIFRLSDGKLLGAVPRPKDITDNYMSIALSQDGKRLGVMKRDELRVFDALAGKELASHKVIDDSYGRNLHSWSGGWLLSSEARSQMFNEGDGKWTTVIPFAGVVHLDEVDTPKGKRFILQNYNGACCLADPADGAVLSRWMAAEYGRVAPRWNAVFANGKAMLRPTGWTAALELVDLRDAQLLLTIHAVPLGKNLGIIAFTPDGWWDASPGAERFVAVLNNGAPGDMKLRDERRDAMLIQARLGALFR